MHSAFFLAVALAAPPIGLQGAPQRRLQFGRIFDGIFNRSAASTACVDEHQSCASWAASGECDANAVYMHGQCKRSCGKCAGAPAVPRRSGGCADDPDYGCAERASAGECDTNKGQMLARCRVSCKVCMWARLLDEAFECADTNPACARWASSGECTANPNYMSTECATSCGMCDSKRVACDRAPDTPPVVRPGDINATFMRIMRDYPQYKPRALSRPGGKFGATSPWVITLQDFVSDEEAEAFKTTCEKHFNRSLAGDMLSPVRTSYQCWCSQNECEEHPRVRDVARRISELTRAPVRYMEPFQVVRYTHGQFYRAHHDQNSGLFTPQGVRVYTFFMYLSTPERGGGTKFNNLGDVVPAIKGNAVLWPSVTSEDPTRDEPHTTHEALPVEEGVKYASNVWIHNYDYRTPAAKNCLLTHKNTH